MLTIHDWSNELATASSQSCHLTEFLEFLSPQSFSIQLWSKNDKIDQKSNR